MAGPPQTQLGGPVPQGQHQPVMTRRNSARGSISMADGDNNFFLRNQEAEDQKKAN